MDSCSECVLPELKRFEAFLKTVQKHKNGRLSIVRLVEALYIVVHIRWVVLFLLAKL